MSTEITEKYGYQWPEFMNELDIELAMIRGKRWGPEGPIPYYERSEVLLWPDDDVHRWSRLALENLAVNTVTVFMGPGDSCKTRSAGKWGLIEYWIDPENTLVVISSTESRGADLRIWGDIKGLFNRAKELWPDLEGHPIDYKNAITTDILATRNNPKARDIRRGLICVPCSKGSDGSGVARYVGIKQKRLRQISDECFPAGTLVDTPTGPKAIETFQAGDLVCNALGNCPVKGLLKRRAESLIRIRMRDGRTISCTPNHPIFTHRGWVKALAINRMDYILSVHEAMHFLRGIIPSHLKSKSVQCLQEGQTPQAVQGVRCEVQGSQLEFQPAVLQSELRGSLESQAAGRSGDFLLQVSKRKALEVQETVVGGKLGHRGPAIRANEEAQPARRKVPSESHSRIQRKTFYARHPHGRGASIDGHAEVGRTSFESHDSSEAPRLQSGLLHDRRGAPGHQTGNRGGRRIPFKFTSEGFGQAQGSTSEGAWVESCEVFKPNAPQEDGKSQAGIDVYNLHVEKHHSYGVAGLLFKNCQWMGPSFLDSVPNYLGKDYRAAFLGNPLDIMDPLGRIAEPVSGWASHPEPTKTTVWDIKLPNSKCVNFVGSDSPNFDYPRDEPPRYPYMVSWLKLDAVKQFWGENSHEFFSQCLGVMRSGLVARRVITPELCRQHGAHEPAIWKNTDITRVYALDPSYGGEDRCIGGMVEFGESEDGTQIIKVYMPKRYTVIPGQAVKPEDQIAIQLKNDLHAMDIPTRNSFYDPYGKGTLGFSFSQIFGADGPIPIDSGAQATERPVRHDLMIFDLKLREKRLKKCSEHYSKFATEAWFSVRYVIECGQMRDLPMDVMRDGCLREFGNRGSKIEIEGKEKTRDRMGRSPDLFDWCFTGDTEVSTPSGHRRIDSLAPGDEVVTPLGNTTIECVRVRTAKDLVCCSFSDGTSLTGLGEHRIFTRNRGWAALDSLTLVDEIDFESDRFKWQILSRLFTRETPITFKAQADIISAERVAVNRRDFFIESYGCNTVALCLKGIVSIMKMVIGGITASKIFGSLRDRIMPDTTCWSVENFASVLAARFKSLGYYPQNYGTSPKREDAGTLRTQRTSGRITTSQSRVFAKSVEAVTPVSSVGAQSSVLLNAPARTSANVGNSFRRFVSSATRILMRCLTGHRRPVLESVRRFSLPESKLVFNLTLRAHNCYYANGVLAENCAIAVEGCRQRGFKIKNEGGIIVENQREQDEFLERERMYGKFIHDSLLIH